MKIFTKFAILATILSATGSAFAGQVQLQATTNMELSGESSVILFEKFAKEATCETLPTGANSYQLCKFTLDWRENQDVFAKKNKVVQMTCSKINNRAPTCSLDITQN